MKKVQTVLGPISPEDLGVTYPHVHLIIKREVKGDPTFGLPSVENAVEELKSFKEAGGRSVVEGTPVGSSRDIKALVAIARKVPVNIITTTGFAKMGI